VGSGGTDDSHGRHESGRGLGRAVVEADPARNLPTGSGTPRPEGAEEPGGATPSGVGVTPLADLQGKLDRLKKGDVDG
jgi:hypothetical protein